VKLGLEGRGLEVRERYNLLLPLDPVVRRTSSLEVLRPLINEVFVRGKLLLVLAYQNGDYVVVVVLEAVRQVCNYLGR
jgi:hypothetical protein